MTDSEKELHKRFEKAVKMVSETEIEFTPDVKLKFYAYYKRAQGNAYVENPIAKRLKNISLIRGFKMNALFQVSQLSIIEAKKKYIELAGEYFKI